MEEEEQIRPSDSNSMLSSHLGRVMNTLLTSRPKKLQDSISRLGFSSSRLSLEEPLSFLRKYVRDAVERRENLDQVLVPMIESSLKSKDSKQVLILMNWLFQDELVFEPLATSLVGIMGRKDDRYIALGWCNLIRGLVDEESISSLSSNAGVQERHYDLVKIIFPSISHLSSIIRNGSTLQGGFELPTRLAVAAADCMLLLTETSTRKSCTLGVSSTKTKLSDPNAANQPVAFASTASGEKKVKPSSNSSEGSSNLEFGFLLWELLDELIILVQRLSAWSRKSRPLHAKGLEQVLNWLQEIKGHHDSAKDEAVTTGRSILNSGVLLLSSCWKHYSMLLRLEDCRFSQCYMEILNQYISGIQLYMDDYSNEHSGSDDGSIGTRKFFLSCISLLLGRLDGKQFETVMSKHGLEISRILLLQLQSTDEDVIEGSANILRATIFSSTYSSEGRVLPDTRQIEAVFPLLLNLLDERDSAPRAVIVLTAESCSKDINGQCIQEIFKRLGSGNSIQRRNAIDVISELMRISSDFGNLHSLSMQQDMAKHLLDCLGDEEPVICIQASNLLLSIDPTVVLPQLVHLVYSPNERVRSSASDALVAVLKSHNQNLKLIVMLLDCLSQLCQTSDHPKTKGEESGGSKFDTDRILGLIPKWSKTVLDWSIFAEPLVDKMFAEPSNAVIVRFLSYISENLADAPDVILRRVLLHVRRQKEIDDKLLSQGTSGTYRNNDTSKKYDSLFDRLCPLLIIRLLPLRVFDDLTSSVMYSEFRGRDAMYDYKGLDDGCCSCVGALLLNRAFDKAEHEDVRKLAAELCGRVHPQVLFPVVRSQLEHAMHTRDILKMKACLFSVCTSLVLRGAFSANFPAILEIREVLETVLLWPSVEGDEVSKAQHGCIDCLALMICAEVQSPEVSKEPSRNKISLEGGTSNGDASTVNLVLNCVIQKLMHDISKSVPSDDPVVQGHLIKKSDDEFEARASVPLSFHMCMANILISACQKISSSGKKPLAEKLFPVLIRSVKMIKNSDIRAACIQVLFSAVYHLKSAIRPHSLELLKLSIKALRKGSDKEKMASVKLMASLMASEDAVVQSISGGLLEARSVLSSIISTDPSLELKQVCQKLLVCMVSPFDAVPH